MRVIAGRLRGRPILAPKGVVTRPTADRVREALFNVLGDVAQLCVADLYAGSGALGIEALSRGAQHVCFVERTRVAADCIRGNLQRLSLEDTALVIQARVERTQAVLRRQGPYHLVLCDPPWDQLDRALTVLGRLLTADLLADGSTVVIEHPAQQPVEQWDCAGLRLVDRRTWGDTGAVVFKAGVENPSPRAARGQDGPPVADRGV